MLIRLVGYCAMALSTISAHEIAAIIREHEVELLEQDEKLRREGIGLDLKQGITQPDGLGMTDDDLRFYGFIISFLDGGARARAARMRPRGGRGPGSQRRARKSGYRSSPR